MKTRSTLLAAALLGATGVALGAFGAHGIKVQLLERGTTVSWETAARYQLLHAAALLALAGWLRQTTGASERFARWAACCWIAGIAIFSGSLYFLALSGPRWLGPVTPLGGAALIAGWLLLIGSALAKDDVK